MSSLSDEDKSTVRFHLGYNESVEYRDRALLEDRMNNIADTRTVTRIRDQIARCDRTLAKTEIDAQETAPVTNRILLGDVQRTDLMAEAEDLKTRQKNYIYECDQLARFVGAPNWNKPEMDRFRVYSKTITYPLVPAPTELTYNITTGSDLYLYFA
jgi:hypothetical protein